MAAICVFCASSRTLDSTYLDLAAKVGASLAGLGHVLVSGGGRVGMMGAVVEGARAAGGHTVGVIPLALRAAEIADLASDELLYTATMADRKTIMIERSDAFLVLPGGLGTLDELFEVWTTAGLVMHTKPIIVYDYEGFYSGLWAWLRGLVAAEMIPTDVLDTVKVVDSLNAALAALPD